MIVFRVSQVRLTDLLSGGTQAIVLAIFAAPITTRNLLTFMFVFETFQDLRTKDQLDQQAYLEAHREQVMKAIEAWVVYPAILLNFLKTHLQFETGGNLVSGLGSTFESFLLTAVTFSLISYMKVPAYPLPRAEFALPSISCNGSFCPRVVSPLV